MYFCGGVCTYYTHLYKDWNVWYEKEYAATADEDKKMVSIVTYEPGKILCTCRNGSYYNFFFFLKAKIYFRITDDKYGKYFTSMSLKYGLSLLNKILMITIVMVTL